MIYNIVRMSYFHKKNAFTLFKIAFPNAIIYICIWIIYLQTNEI